jgi:hypothetical protein
LLSAFQLTYARTAVTTESKQLLKMSALFALFVAGTAYQFVKFFKDGSGSAQLSMDHTFLGQSTSSEEGARSFPVFPILGIAFTLPALLSAIYEWRYARWVRRKRAMEKALSER